MTNLYFTKKGKRACKVLSLIHTDVCEPTIDSARGGCRYFITFIDDVSENGYVFLIRHKSELFKMFKRHYNEMEK